MCSSYELSVIPAKAAPVILFGAGKELVHFDNPQGVYIDSAKEGGHCLLFHGLVHF